MANLTSMKVELFQKEKGLENSQRALKFFKKSADANVELIKETETIIRQLKQQISDLKEKIRKAESAKKKK